MINLTEKAADKVKEVMKDEELSPKDAFLRVAVRGGGCSGFEYLLDIVSDETENDLRFDQHDIKVVCDDKSHLYLDGTEIDYCDGLMGKGFAFNNPNATSRCGCGSSFST